MFERIKNFIKKIFDKKTWWIFFILFTILAIPLNNIIVKGGFPSDFFGYRGDISPDPEMQTFKALQGFAKFQYNGTYGGRPDNISFNVNIVCSGVNPCKVAMSIYDASGNIKAWTTHTTYTSSISGWIRYSVNYTTNTTPLVKNTYYYIGIWSSLTGTIPSASFYYEGDYGTNLGVYTRSDTGYFAWDNGISFTTVDATATANCFVNYTEISNPNPPSNFNVVTVYGSDSSLYMSWTKGLYALKTRIQRNSNGSYPETAWEGTNVYNDTGTSYTNTGLTANTVYHYSAWSWNTTFASYSLTYVSDNERVFVKPIKPSDFIGNNISYTRNLFAWTNGINATVTRVQYNVNTTYPVTVSTGINTYNSTNTYNDDSGLLKNSSYYYSAWSFNLTNGLWSNDYITLKINTNDTIYGSVGCDNTSLTVYNNTAHTTGEYQTSYSSVTGWKIWLNYTGKLPTFNHYENIVDATGTHQHNSADSGYTINSWANYTGFSSGGMSLTLFENLINVTGIHEYKNNSGDYIVWANYTGNESLFDENDYLLPIFTTISLCGIGLLIIKKRRKNE